MNLYRDTKHPDCWIECPGSGTAVYADPPGRCFKNCGEEGLAISLAEALPGLVSQSRLAVSTSIPSYAIANLLELDLDDVDDGQSYQSVIERIDAINNSLGGAHIGEDFVFTGETTLIGLLTMIADHFEAERAA